MKTQHFYLRDYYKIIDKVGQVMITLYSDIVLTLLIDLILKQSIFIDILLCCIVYCIFIQNSKSDVEGDQYWLWSF